MEISISGFDSSIRVDSPKRKLKICSSWWALVLEVEPFKVGRFIRKYVEWFSWAHIIRFEFCIREFFSISLICSHDFWFELRVQIKLRVNVMILQLLGFLIKIYAPVPNPLLALLWNLFQTFPCNQRIVDTDWWHYDFLLFLNFQFLFYKRISIIRRDCLQLFLLFFSRSLRLVGHSIFLWNYLWSRIKLYQCLVNIYLWFLFRFFFFWFVFILWYRGLPWPSLFEVDLFSLVPLCFRLKWHLSLFRLFTWSYLRNWFLIRLFLWFLFGGLFIFTSFMQDGSSAVVSFFLFFFRL